MLHGRYSDGLRPVSHDVTIEREPGGLRLTLTQSGAVMHWNLAETRVEREEGEARLHRVVHGADTGERLVTNLLLFERVFANDLRKFGKGRAGEASPLKIAIWSAAAVASILAIFFIGLPLLARVATPIIPLTWEARLGASFEPQVREMFGEGGKSKSCGKPDGPGRKALALMTQRLTEGRAMPFPPKIEVLDINVINAFALPGGYVFLFRPVLERAEGANEVAGVLAHELGHVVHRHSMRALLHSSALSLLVGLVIGDVTGGVTVSILTNLIGQSYSRDAEREADRTSVEMMAQAGADPRAINAFFERLLKLEGGSGGLTNLFRSHPLTRERIDAVEKMSEGIPATRASILSPQDWAALKSICRE